MSLTKTENDARAYGYVRCPNNAQRWYSGGPFVLMAPTCMDVQIENGTDRPVVLSCSVYAGGRVDVSRFENWAGYVTWLSVNGHKSPGGQARNY